MNEWMKNPFSSICFSILNIWEQAVWSGEKKSTGETF